VYKLKKILLVLLLLCLPLALATEFATVNDSYTLWADVITGTSFYDATNATLTVTNPDLNIIYNNVNMSKVDIGTFIYTFTPNITGEYYLQVEFYNATGVVSIATGTLVVQDNYTTEIEDIMIEEAILVFALAILVIFLAFYIGNWALMILGGILFFVLGFYDVFTKLPASIELPMFLLAGVLIIYQGIAYFTQERKESMNNDRKR